MSGNAQEGRRKVCESTKTLDDGGGALKCFYKETFAEEMTGEYAVRCFTTKDPHGDLVFTDKQGLLPRDHPWVHDGICDGAKNDARDCDVNWPDYNKDPDTGTQIDDVGGKAARDNQRLTCRSPPLCFKIKVAARAQARQQHARRMHRA